MSKDYGLQATGFNIKPKSEIVKDIQTQLTSSLGAPLNFSAPSGFSQFIEPFAAKLAEQWELAGAIYASQFPDTAEDASLDGACSYVGLKRLEATKTTVNATVTCDNFTEIPEGSKALLQDTSYTFSAKTNIVANTNACYKCVISIDTVVATRYDVNINGDLYTCTPEATDTAALIAGLLTSAINNGSIVTAVNSDNTIVITSKTFENNLTVRLNANMSFSEVSVTALFLCDIAGSISVPTGALNEIYTPVLGWNSVTNAIAGENGRDLENDIAFRARRDLSQQIGGSGTKDAIASRLRAVSGVSSVQVLENRTNTTNADGLPAKSLSAIVLGGEDADIGLTIWKAKPGGIELYGNTSVTVQDSDGDEQIVKFSRAIKFYIFVNITLTTNDDFIEASKETIRASIVKHLNSQNVGELVVYQSLYKYVYAEKGITAATITIGGTLDPLQTPALSADNIIVASDRISSSDATYITIA